MVITNILNTAKRNSRYRNFNTPLFSHVYGRKQGGISEGLMKKYTSQTRSRSTGAMLATTSMEELDPTPRGMEESDFLLH